jgi:hypothetical protein
MFEIERRYGRILDLGDGTRPGLTLGAAPDKIGLAAAS